MNELVTALLFPGQGSQEPGMGRDVAEADADIMDLWKKAERISGIKLREIYWENENSDMAWTRALQPALTATNLGYWMRLRHKLKPACTAGHSLGEYSSLAASGVLSIDSVLELTSLRGRLMSEADPKGKGAMAALLKLPLAEAEAVVAEAGKKTGEMLLIANYNTPGQFVISGTKAAIEAAQECAKAKKGRAVPLAVSGAFHSPLMEEAAKELAKELRKASWSKAKFPVYCNVSGRPLSEAGDLLAMAIRQMTSSVLWIDTIRQQWQDGARRFVECGPKTVLTKMVIPILAAVDPEAKDNITLASVGSGAAATEF